MRDLTVTCQELYHPGRSCPAHFLLRLRRSGRFSFWVYFLASFLPDVVRQRKKLKSDFKPTFKRILKKYLVSSTVMTVMLGAPFALMCLFSRFTKIDKKINILVWALSCLIWVFESYRQQQYSGWLIPRNVIIYYRCLVFSGYAREIPGAEKMTAVLAAAAIGLAANRGHWNQGSRK